MPKICTFYLALHFIAIRKDVGTAIEDCDTLDASLHSTRCRQIGGSMSLPEHLHEDSEAFITVNPVCFVYILYVFISGSVV